MGAEKYGCNCYGENLRLSQSVNPCPIDGVFRRDWDPFDHCWQRHLEGIPMEMWSRDPENS